MQERKIVILILEGDQDSSLFSSYVASLLSQYKLEVKVTNGDVFTDLENRESSGEEIILKLIHSVIKPLHLNIEDVAEIVQFVDIDGSYTDFEDYEVDDKISYYGRRTYEYHQKHGKIKVKSKEKLAELFLNWSTKKKFQEELWNIGEVNGIPFSMYYYSINLEHFLSDDLFLNDSDKWYCIDSFVDSHENLDDVYSFLSLPEKKVSDDYNDSWNYLSTETNLFKKGVSNINIFFNRYMGN